MNKIRIRIISENKFHLNKKRRPRGWPISKAVDIVINHFQLYHFYV